MSSNRGTKRQNQTQLGSFFTTTTTKKKKVEEESEPATSSSSTTTTAPTTTEGESITTTTATTNNTSDDVTKDVTEKEEAVKKEIDAASASSAAAAGAAEPSKSEPLVPQVIDSNKLKYRVSWESHYDSHIIIRKVVSWGSINRKKNPPTKIAAFDIDGTLMNWTTPPGVWPSSLNHYELWSSTNVIPKLRDLYDNGGYRLLLISNQGGIQKAHSGKKATKIKQIIDWIAHIVDRPIEAVLSTRTIKKCPNTSYHKPTRKMWNVAEKLLFKTTCSSSSNSGGSSKSNGRFFSGKTTASAIEIDLSQSFFVGDSADPNDEQGGVDRKFANNVGLGQFYEPTEYFGPSDLEVRQQQKLLGLGGSDVNKIKPIPNYAINTRAALMGRYLQGPILLILCGVQGSGKSTFCQALVGKRGNNDGNNNSNHWICLSQDTINNGKPGPRSKVEKEAIRILKEEGKKKSVIIDRMHLTPEQRQYFYDIASQCQVQAHVVMLNPTKNVVTKRVQSRTNHPGGVQGSQGVKLVLQSLSQIVLPTYDERNDDDDDGSEKKDYCRSDGSGDTFIADGPQLISCTSTRWGAVRLADLYKCGVIHDDDTLTAPVTDDSDHHENAVVIRECGEHKADTDTSATAVKMPIISLGTMGIGKRITKDVITKSYEIGCRSVDTAPTYKNEDRVGDGLQEINGGDHSASKYDDKMFCIVKIPKRVTKPEEVRHELVTSLEKLKLDKEGCDLLLLHWPCDVIESGTLTDVWKEMEQCLKDGSCRALGVCNFNVAALQHLLNCGITIRPSVNQVERHPLLPQYDLIDYCSRQDIIVQAHTPFGHGNKALLEYPTITEIAVATSLTPCQVIAQWNLQQGIPIVPKFSNEEHGRELFQLLHSKKTKILLSPDAMLRINNIAGVVVGKKLKENNNTKRFVAPPFMYGKMPYCWGEHAPPRGG